MKARRAASLHFQIKWASGETTGSGQVKELSSQHSKPCCRERRLILRLQSTQFDLPMSTIRLSGQDVPVRVQMVRWMPLGVTPKIELAKPPEVGVGAFGMEAFIMVSSVGEEDIWMGADRVRKAREDARKRRERNNKNIDEREREKIRIL